MGHFRHGRRAASLVICATSLSALSACYEYKPLNTRIPPVGEPAAFEISDQGRISLADRFGPELSEIQGRVVSNQGNEYVLNVFRVSQSNGLSSAWTGETARLDKSFVRGIKGREFSPSRTGLLVLVGAATAYVIISRDLVGGFTGGREEPPGDPPLSQRIPLRFPVRIRF